jgi:DNA-binding response OmpR family regulator
MEARMRADNGRRVVLVVEDDPLIRSDIVSELDWQGWQVIDTGRAEAALEVINTGQIDVLVTDIDLGRSLSGWDLGEAVRRASPAVVVVYVSANDPDATRVVAGGVFLPKPFDVIHVVETCHRLCS